MSWTRKHLDELAELQLRTQRIIETAGTDAKGVDLMIEVNEGLSKAQDLVLSEVEKAERHRDESRCFAEALRPFVQEGQ